MRSLAAGQNNRYAHPRAEVLNRLRPAGTKVYRTDEQGAIIAISDGETIIFDCPPSDSWKAGEPGSTAASEA